jgi:hypothetical protein
MVESDCIWSRETAYRCCYISSRSRRRQPCSIRKDKNAFGISLSRSGSRLLSKEYHQTLLRSGPLWFCVRPYTAAPHAFGRSRRHMRCGTR